MSDVQTYKRLRNKFLQAELEYEDRESRYQVTLNDLKKLDIKPIQEKEHFFLLKLALRFFKTIFKSISISVKVFAGVVKESVKKISARIYSVYLAKKENVEFVIEKKVITLEDNLKFEKEKMYANDKELLNIVEEYEKNLNLLFSGVKCSFKVSGQKIKAHEVRPNLDFHQALHIIILKKVLDSKMILNIEEMSIDLALQNETVLESFVFKLKSKGHVWSVLFSKYIMSSLFKKIENFDGKMSARHSFNATSGLDEFTFFYEHCRLLTYVQSEEFKIENQKNKLSTGKKTVSKNVNVEV